PAGSPEYEELVTRMHDATLKAGKFLGATNASYATGGPAGRKDSADFRFFQNGRSNDGFQPPARGGRSGPGGGGGGGPGGGGRGTGSRRSRRGTWHAEPGPIGRNLTLCAKWVHFAPPTAGERGAIRLRPVHRGFSPDRRAARPPHADSTCRVHRGCRPRAGAW